MRILAFVDMHGSAHAMVELKKKAKSADLIICAGDYTQFEHNNEQIMKVIAELKKPVVIIHGNHEEASIVKASAAKYKNIAFIHAGFLRIKPYLFIGWGGGGFSDRDEGFEAFAKKIKKEINKDDKVILVTHAPPYNTAADDLPQHHCGNKSIRNFIDEVKPVLAVSGHIHETAGRFSKVGPTMVVNPGPKGMYLQV